MKLRALQVAAVVVPFVVVLGGCSSRSEDAREGAPRPVSPASTAQAVVQSSPLATAKVATVTTIAATKDAVLTTPSSDLPVAPASHAVATVAPTTCPQVALQTTATGKASGFDETTASSVVSFQIPGTLTVTAGNAHDFRALLEYGPTTTEATETECLYVPSSATQLRLAECHMRARHGQPKPGAGATVSGTHFELHVDPVERECHDTVTVRVELGSVATSAPQACTTDTCGAHGGVVHAPAPAGTVCSPATACVAASTCNATGVCVAGAPVPIDDHQSCTTDQCDPVLGVTHTPVAAGTVCGAATVCTAASTCDAAGACVAGAPLPIDDANACTTDACSIATGITHTPVADGSICGPGDVCSGASTCSAGTCMRGAPAVIDDGSPCTIDQCTPATGVTHTPVAAGTSCSDGNACNGNESCNASGACVAGAPPVIDTSNPCLIGSCDPATGVSYHPAAVGTTCGGDVCSGVSTCTSTGACQPGAPPNLDDADACTRDTCALPAGIAHTPIPGCGVPLVPPPLDTSVSYDFVTATSFLYTGANPVQVGVAPGAIDPVRQAVFRGRVLDVNGAPLRGVQISARGHGELGVSYTRDDGRFDFAANGGMSLVIEMLGQGFIPVSRLASSVNHDFVTLADVVLTKRDTAVAAIDLDSGAYQSFSATPQTDADGTRTASLFFPPGTTSDLAGVSTLHVRATEFTVGALGKNAMPGVLPPTSAYTYALNLSVDEAEALGVARVTFNQPVYVYVDNFINLPVGGAVPTGTYDRDSGTWVPMANGIVLTILSTSGGIAHLDVTGDGAEDAGASLVALGITAEEQAQLAMTYAGATNRSFWRVPMRHFSDPDMNLPAGSGGSSGCGEKCKKPPPKDPNPCADVNNASTIACTSQVFGEQWSVAGTPFELHYTSERALGHLPTLHLGLGAAPFDPKLLRVDVTIDIAGVKKVFPVAVADIPKGLHFVWDRKDAYGRDVPGQQLASVSIGYVYKAVYLKPGEKFGDAPGADQLTQSRPRGEVSLQTLYQVPLSGVTPHPGLGGVTLSAHHFLDTFGGTLYYGDGRRSNFAQTLHVADVAGSASGSAGGAHVPITAANIQRAAAPSGPMASSTMSIRARCAYCAMASWRSSSVAVATSMTATAAPR